MVLATRTSAPNTSLAVIRPKPRPDSPTASEISVIMLKSELPHEASNPVSKKEARVHHAARRHGSVAARGARAAAGGAGDRVSQRQVAGGIGRCCGRVSPRFERDGIRRGRNVALEYRWAEGHNERLPDLAADLVQRQVAVIAAVGGNNSALAAKAATATIPIVFTSGADPIKVGLVTSLNQPGGHVTGVSWFGAELGPKRLGLLAELVPHIALAVLLVNPNSPETAGQPETVRQAAGALGWRLQVIQVGSENEID